MVKEMGINLPTKKVAAEIKDPRVFILYALPKAGKTTLISTLPNNLILDLEDGASYVDALKVRIIGLNIPKEAAEVTEQRHSAGNYYLQEVGAAIMKQGRPYQFITVDTVTMLEEMVLPRAADLYRETPMGKDFEGNDILSLPRGAGYYYLRLAFKEWVGKIKKLADRVILIGHLKDTFIDKKGKEVQAKDIDLTGKIKTSTCADADAVGYLYRGPEDELMINFKSSDGIICGARCTHLCGKEIKIADYDKNSNSLTNIKWELIYPDIFSNK